MARHSNSWPLFLRYQAQAERNYRRALEEFSRLQALRAELPNQPISGLQPEPIQTTSNPVPSNPNPPEPPPVTGSQPALATDHWPLATSQPLAASPAEPLTFMLATG